MDSIEVAKIKQGQEVTMTFGEKDITLTRLDEPGKFTLAGWYEEEEKEIYLLDPTIEEEAILHYSLTPVTNPQQTMELDNSQFGINKVVLSFFNRPVESLEMEEDEEEEDEEADDS